MSSKPSSALRTRDRLVWYRTDPAGTLLVAAVYELTPLKDVCLGVPVKLGAKGLEQVIEVKLTDAERAALKKSAESVRETMAVAQL